MPDKSHEAIATDGEYFDDLNVYCPSFVYSFFNLQKLENNKLESDVLRQR